MTTPFDAVTLEVLWTRIISIVDEAAKAIVCTSFSTLSNEANDFACMLTDARGYALAQNTGSILLQRRHGRHQGRRERALVAEQYLLNAGRGGRAQQPVLLPSQATAAGGGRRGPVSRRARSRYRVRVRVRRADRRLVHGQAHEVPGAGLRGRRRRRAG